MTRSASVQKAAGFVGALLVLAGLLGLVPGATTDYRHLGLAGRTSTAELLGTFRVSVLHDALHLLLGAAGLAAARTAASARTFLRGGGVLLLVVWLLGVSGFTAWLPANPADNWLHFVLGSSLLGLGSAPAFVQAPGVAGSP